MGNSSSVPSEQLAEWPTHPHHHPPPIHTETQRSITVTPFEPAASTSVASLLSQTSSNDENSPVPTRTIAHCTWGWEGDASSCTSWTQTPDIYTLSTASNPTGAYETPAETSYTFTQVAYTCTDFVCIGSVASSYGYSLCLPTPTTKSKHLSLPILTLSFPSESEFWSTPKTASQNYITQTVNTCDAEFGWDDCTTTSFGVSGPLSTETTTSTSDCDTTSTLSKSSKSKTSTETDDCVFGDECYTSLQLTIPESLPTSSTTTTKSSFTYETGSARRTSKTTTTTSECDFWDRDCIPTPTRRHSTWDWDDPWSGHTVRTTIHGSRQTPDAEA
jgi:hypothetical protein